MKRVYRIDPNGLYVEDVLLEDNEELSEGLYDLPEPIGFYKPRYDGEKWVEGLTQSEIDVILNQPKPKTEIELLEERLALSEAALDFLIMNGGI